MAIEVGSHVTVVKIPELKADARIPNTPMFNWGTTFVVKSIAENVVVIASWKSPNSNKYTTTLDNIQPRY